jgi:hypothetical protein
MWGISSLAEETLAFEEELCPMELQYNPYTMNCWGIRIYFTKSRFSLNGGLFVYMELLSGHEKIITKSGSSLNAGTLNRGFIIIIIIIIIIIYCNWVFTRWQWSLQ